MAIDIVKDVTLPAPIERVWAALTDPSTMQGWIGPDKKRKVDLRVGGKYVIFDGETTGTFILIDRPYLLEYSWRQGTWAADWPDSLVRWELSSDGGETHIHLTH